MNLFWGLALSLSMTIHAEVYESEMRCLGNKEKVVVDKTIKNCWFRLICIQDEGKIYLSCKDKVFFSFSPSVMMPNELLTSVFYDYDSLYLTINQPGNKSKVLKGIPGKPQATQELYSRKSGYFKFASNGDLFFYKCQTGSKSECTNKERINLSK